MLRSSEIKPASFGLLLVRELGTWSRRGLNTGKGILCVGVVYDRDVGEGKG